jgi:hypothetical protein
MMEFDCALAEWAGTRPCNLLTRSVALVPETLRLSQETRTYLTSEKDAVITVALAALGAGGARSAAGCLALLQNGLTSSAIPLVRVLAEVELHIELIEADDSGVYAARWLEHPPSRIRHLFGKRSAYDALHYRYLSKFSHADNSLASDLHETLERHKGAWSLLEEGAERDTAALLVSLYAARISKLMFSSGFRALEVVVGDHAEVEAERLQDLARLSRFLLEELTETLDQIDELARSSFDAADVEAAVAWFRANA